MKQANQQSGPENRKGIRRQSLNLLILLVVFVSGLLYLYTSAPLKAVTGTDMEPALNHGDLVIYNPVRPEKLAKGDLVLILNPETGQTLYRRIVSIQYSGGSFSFRTAGDSSGEDLFVSESVNIRGQINNAWPWLGYPLILLQNRYVVGGALILAAGLILFKSRSRFKIPARSKPATAPIDPPVVRPDPMIKIEQKMEDMTDRVVKSMNGFSEAMAEYALHIASHTGAIKSLAEAAKHMESVLAKQDAAVNASLARNSDVESKNSGRPAVEEPAILETEPARPAAPTDDSDSYQPGIQTIVLSSDTENDDETGSVELNNNPFTLTPDAAKTPIEVTPELKLAVKEFIFNYNLKHGIEKLEMTPEFRAAVWEFIQGFTQNGPLPEPGSYIKAIKTVKIQPDTDGLDFNELENERSDWPKVNPL